MPTLGFLKKKRTKDSSGSNDLSSPVEKTTSNTTGGPIAPTLSQNIFAEPESTDAHPAPDSSAPAGAANSADQTKAAGGQQFAGQDASSNTQNVPSIQNMVNQPDYNGTPAPSQHDSAYSSGGGSTAAAAPGATPGTPFSQQKAAANPLRETKGKYTLGDFQIQRTLGTGSFGRVHLVQSKHNQRFYAVKVLKKAQVVKMKQVEHTNDERRMLQRCKHPFLITLWGTFQDCRNLYMVMDFIEGGELFSLLRKSQVSCFVEAL